MAELIVVDDEADLRLMLADYLGLAGHGVRLAADGGELRRLLEERPADLVLLDVGLPGEDGLKLARWLRERHDPGIVMLTGADTVIDRVVGLEVGADDYVTKPCDLGELRARIDAVLRRRRPKAASLPEGFLPFGPYRFDTRRFRLCTAAGEEVPLSEMELDLVAAFATHPGKVLGREDLLRLAPPRGEDSFDRSIDNRITRLRRKLERDPARPELIKTVRGAGYIFPG
ncbi:response regulator [Benzoatithermus flavus]|uniref:Response regulator transcription factor n=1 Tax=Benzoatithermus flavus TaxID=3108223 RepID=A0ABU8XRL5_9PROT